MGWNRQLRITPLSVRSYFRAKVVTGYMMAGLTLIGLYLAGTTLGVSLTGSEWARMTALILVGLLPFAALGIVLGHLLTPDSIGPVMGGLTALFAILGGTWFPITNGAMKTSARHCRRTGSSRRRTCYRGHGWTSTGWAVVAVWTVGAALLQGGRTGAIRSGCRPGGTSAGSGGRAARREVAAMCCVARQRVLELEAGPWRRAHSP